MLTCVGASHVQVTESEEEVRELQAQTVQFSERVVKLQTLLQVHISLGAEFPRGSGKPFTAHRPTPHSS